MLDAQPAVAQRLMGSLLCPGQLGVAGCVGMLGRWSSL